ncbi:MAG TPA: response regulator [Pseudomonadales bacterium]|nr:response regulator [Pseudomonadales bacterium]
MQKTILLVEDNLDDQLLTKAALEMNNILNEVVIAENGVEALDYLNGKGKWEGRNVDDLPALVLLDLNMPKMGGFDVLKHIRAEPKTELLPVVVLTTSQEDCDLVDSYKNGANSYVKKPVDFDEFTEAAKQLGIYWLMVNESPLKNR